MKKRTSPQFVFFAFLVVSMGLVAAFCLFFRLGWQTHTSSLTTVRGNADKLKDFTVKMRVSVASIYDYEYLVLENGVLSSEVSTNDSGILDAFENPVVSSWYDTYVSVIGETENNQSETVSDASSDRIQTNNFWKVVTLSDSRSGRQLRLPVEELHVQQPKEAVTMNPGDSESLSNYQEAQLTDETVGTEELFGRYGFSIGLDWGFCQRTNQMDRVPGLYRVTESPADQQLEELMNNGLVEETETPEGSSDGGHAELFYTTDDCKRAWECIEMADGYLLFLFVNRNDRLCIDIVAQDGRRTDRWESIAADEQLFISLEPRQDLNGAVLSVSSPASRGGDANTWLAVYCRNGRFVTAKAVQPNERSKDATAVLDDSGDALLTFTPVMTEFPAIRDPFAVQNTPNDQYISGYELQILDMERDLSRVFYLILLGNIKSLLIEHIPMSSDFV